MDLIKDGDFVVIQRDNYMKSNKLNAAKNCLVSLGKDMQIEMTNVIGHRYGSAFKLVPHETKRKLWQVEHTDEVISFENLFMDGDSEMPSGVDNRNLVDSNSKAQGITREQIEEMKKDRMGGTEIVEQLIENSASFHSKTKYSQAKFLKKKSKKYFPYVVIKKPSIRLLMLINYKNDPIKMMNLRIDTLAQILNSANIRSGGQYMVYETGCQGMVIASALERLGFLGKIVHIYQTGSPQTQSISAMNFGTDKEKLHEVLMTINMYHLRSLDQGKDITHMHSNSSVETSNPESAATPTTTLNSESKPEVSSTEAPNQTNLKTEATNETQNQTNSNPPFRQRQREESIKSFELMKEAKMDGLIIACKQHPTNILLALVKYLAFSRPFVVYSPYKEPLMEAYQAIKESGKSVMVTLNESWLRNYQILPERSHPEVLMSGGGGYILSGIYVDNTPVQDLEQNGCNSAKKPRQE